MPTIGSAASTAAPPVGPTGGDVAEEVSGGADGSGGGSGRSLSSGWRRDRLPGRFAGLTDFGDGRAHGQGLALFGEDAEEFAFDGRGDLHGDLVGDDLDQRLIPPDGVAGLLEPFTDGAFDYRLANVGQLYRYRQLITTCPCSSMLV